MSDEGREDETLTGDAGRAEVRGDDSTLSMEARPAGDHARSGLDLPERYEGLRLLGSGGFGEVHQVRDRKLERVVAMKVVRPDVVPSLALRARFLAEIKLTAGLSHPGIVAVHDYGELDDGRLWFTMPEIRGRTFHDVLEEASATPGAGPPRRRLLDVFARICDTVAYAHSRGVIHRDIKPANVMVGEFGQVMVMDWGIARGALEAGARAEPAAPADAPPPGGPPSLTRFGDVLGTPAYMAPEQAHGEVDKHGPATDVYALGAMLHHVLVGRPPRSAYRPRTSWEEPPEDAGALAAAPPELAAICRRALAREPEARYPDAGALATAIASFLDGAARRERALAALAEAEAEATNVTDLRARAEEARANALRALATVKPSDPAEIKLPGWDLEDEAERLERDVALGETAWVQVVHGALAVDPGLDEAHDALADHYRAALLEAERARRHADAARFELLLRAHDRGRHTALLRGDGAITLVTDPPGARVAIQRYTARARRLVLDPARDLGVTPLVEVALPHGSYLLTIRAEGRAEVRYPVLVERGEHWDGRAPGEADPFAIPLPRAGEIGPDEVYVPAGWAFTGGDPEAADALPRRRIWIDGFVMRRLPVTNREMIELFADVEARGLDAAALGLPSSHPGLLRAALALPGVRRDEQGRILFHQDGLDAPFQPDWPASVDGYTAAAYARWLAIRTGLRFRLPSELEREKAARGADARLFPWGDHPEPAFACVLETHRGEPTPAPVGSFSADESPYGARDLAGNVRDWCANLWTHGGPLVDMGRLRLEAADPERDDFWSIRGGGWGSSIVYARSAARFGGRPAARSRLVGVRPVRSYPGTAGTVEWISSAKG